MQTGRGATITWTSYNLPASITNGTLSSAFSYKPDRGYWKQVAQYSGGSETTVYVDGLLEKVTSAGGTDYRHMIRAGSATIVVTRSTGTNNDTYYVTRDNLGSSTAVTNSAGALVVNESFAAYGARRGSNWTGTPTSGNWTAIANSTRRGYTQHTMLDNVSLIHMNGRVYDPTIGRFASGDPYLDAYVGMQGLNRFAYVGNGMLSRSDASGFDTERGFTLRAWINPNEITPGYQTGEVDDPILVSAHQRDQSWWISEIHITANSHPSVGNNEGNAGGGSDSAPIDTVVVTANRRRPQSQLCHRWNGEAGGFWDGVSGNLRQVGNDISKLLNDVGKLLTWNENPDTDALAANIFGSNDTSAGIFGADLAQATEVIAPGIRARYLYNLSRIAELAGGCPAERQIPFGMS